MGDGRRRGRGRGRGKVEGRGGKVVCQTEKMVVVNLFFPPSPPLLSDAG